MKTHGIAESIKDQIAAAIVRESQPGYMRSYTGESYVVDMDGDQEFDAVIFKTATAQWNPWPDNVTALAVQALYEHCEGDVDFTLEDGDDPELAEQLALEYMPDYYPPFDVNEDDDDPDMDEAVAEIEAQMGRDYGFPA